MKTLVRSLIMTSSLFGLAAHAFCFDKAAQQYQISEPLLRAIAFAESGNNPKALHFNADGSTDLGLMQINSSHLAQLAGYGIGKTQLLEPCTNVMVGAWVLAQSIKRYGLTWRAVGSYNTGVRAGRDDLRKQYVRRVKPIFERLARDASEALAAKQMTPRSLIAVAYPPQEANNDRFVAAGEAQ